jgi:hypothetical protein
VNNKIVVGRGELKRGEIIFFEGDETPILITDVDEDGIQGYLLEDTVQVSCLVSK